MKEIEIVNLPLDENCLIINTNTIWLLSGKVTDAFFDLIKKLEKKKIPYILYLNEKIKLGNIRPEAIIVNTFWPKDTIDFLICEAISVGAYIFYEGDLSSYEELKFIGQALPDSDSLISNFNFIREILNKKTIRCSYIREGYEPQINLFKNLSLNLKDSLSHTFSQPRYNFISIFKFKEDIIFERKPVKNNLLNDYRDSDGLLHIYFLFDTPTNNKSNTPRILPKEGLSFYFRIIDENNKFLEEKIVKIIQEAVIEYLPGLNFRINENDLYIDDCKVFGGMTFSDPYARSGTIGCFYIYIDFEKEKELFNRICSDTNHKYKGLNFYIKNLNEDDLALFIIKKVKEEFENG